MNGFVKINGANLYYEMAGEGASLVFIHGFSLDNRIWNEQFNYFSKSHRVLKYDLRGFGKSDLPGENNYSHIYDLKSLLDMFELSEVTLIGLSLGGSIATQFTIKFPDYVKKLILVDSDLDGFERKMKTGLRNRGLSIEEAKRAWLSHPLLHYASHNSKSRDLLFEIVKDYSGWHWKNEDKAVSIFPPSIYCLNLIQCPTLIIIGQYDISDFHHIASVLNENIRDSKKVVINNAGHLSNLEMPSDFTDCLNTYFRADEF